MFIYGDFMETFLDILLDTCLDCVRLLPFLFIAFLLIEALEHYSSAFSKKVLERVGKAGPVLGALCGCIPQCGFSVLAANLFAGGMISPGTLIAVFLSTSDEAVIILLGNPGYLKEIAMLILTKLIIAVAAGYVTDLLFSKRIMEPRRAGELCEHCGCHDEEEEHEKHSGLHHVLIPALRHTLQIFIYLFIFILALNLIVELIGEEAFSGFLLVDSVFQPFLAALIGFIPNCAASVILTQLYLNGVLSFASVIAGLCTGAGAGLLVLLRVNRHRKETAKILALLYGYAVAAGVILFLAGA